MNIEELITKYLTKESTPEENTAILNWVISSEGNKREFVSYCQNWYSISQTKEINTINSDKAYSAFLHKTQKQTIEISKTRTISIWQKISAVAAVAILTIGAFVLFNQQPKAELLAITNNQNSISDVILPDGSHIFLHKNASVEYPSEFESNNRTISAHGHFFCEVKPNKEAPFTVENENITIQVLGTAFDVNSKDKTAEVIVAHGKVSVTAQSKSVILEKGERADFNNNSLLKSNNTDINFLSWQTGTLTFNSTELSQVFKDIERHYDCKINVIDSSILSNKITGTYSNYSLQDIITIVSSAFPSLTFTQENNTFTVSK